MNIHTSLCLSLVLSQVAVSQGSTGPGAELVLPHTHATTEGTGWTNVPFGRGLALRCQMAYMPETMTAAAVIKELAFRPDGGFDGNGKRISMHLFLGTLPSLVTELHPEFARNRGADYTDVFGCRFIDLPGKASLPSQVSFPVRLPLTRSFQYDPKVGPLLCEIGIADQPTGAYQLDATGVCSSPVEYYGPPGCGPQNGPVLELQSMTQQIVWGNPVVLRVANAKPSALTYVFLGLQGSGTWRGIPLPFDASVIGAPGCFLSTSVIEAPRRFANGMGLADYGWNLPRSTLLRGAEIHAQAIADDPTANPLGAVSSRACRLRVCGMEPVGRVFANGLDSTVGAVEHGVAPVLQLVTE
ncbi:MAG: hypothetical protein KDC87_16315 [Planctomycetes bacterium]|nr:hypothetical protein [Planctomycetota bacterium]MCB9869658.1 hypothetical protein [Planctomycetota bacterium]